ncbi:MAG: sulfurtransferase TusA family protein [Myxococcaceae bacterium]
MGSAKVEMPVVQVNACDTFCPVPIVELAKAVRKSRAGDEIELLATDPAMEGEVRAWCDATGHLLLEQAREGDLFRARIQVTGWS